MITWDLRRCHGNAISKRCLAKIPCKINGFCTILSEIVPKTTFSAKNKSQYPILNPCVKFESNWLRNKTVSEKILISDRRSGLKLVMTSYSDNAYDVTNLFVVLKSSWPILYSYQVSLLSDPRWQSKTGEAFLPPPPIHYRGIPDPVQNKVNLDQGLSQKVGFFLIFEPILRAGFFIKMLALSNKKSTFVLVSGFFLTVKFLYFC